MVDLQVLLYSSLLALLHYTEGSAECTPTEFKCTNGRCITIHGVCNGYIESSDNSDEKVCDPFDCHPAAFQCLNGKCIARYQICYSGDHCGDNSDEQLCVKSTDSSRRKLTAGVPQGGILAPYIFVLYMNDIPQQQDITLSLYADDTAIISQGKKPHRALDPLQKHLLQLEAWLIKWKIKLNVDKTEVILFYTILPRMTGHLRF